MEKIVLMIDKAVEKSRKLKVNLENNDYRVLITKDISEALILINANDIDLIVLFDLEHDLDKIKTNEKSKDIPIMGIFEDKDKENVSKYKKELDDYIFIPYEREQLYLKLKNQVKINKLQRQIAAKELELIKAYEELNNFGLIDKVTGLYNRFYFEHMLKNQIATSRRYGYQLSGIIITVDNRVDEVSKLNEILKFLAGILKDNIRTNDILVRLNSEEFYLLLPHTGLKDAAYVAEKLRKIVDNYKLDDEKVTFSAGVTTLGTFESGISKEEELVKQARDAMKKAIEQGGNKVVCH